jgi:hypothetical protein
MLVTIECCRDCHLHAWHLTHEEKAYQELSDRLVGQLRENNFEYQLVPHARPASFEVTWGSQLVFSKLKSHKWPNVGSVVQQLVRLREGPREATASPRTLRTPRVRHSPPLEQSTPKRRRSMWSRLLTVTPSERRKADLTAQKIILREVYAAQ